MRTAASCSMSCVAPPRRALCRSRSAAGCAASRISARSSRLAPIKSRSIRPRWRAAVLSKKPPKNSAISASWWLDAKQVAKTGEPARWEIFTHGGRHPTGIDALAYAREVAALGAGEILLTSMDRDGTRKGFDTALTRAVADAVTVPVIASGGVGNLDH